mmetsp:Transcript_23789/g.30954  ORF Transcript_23789/g.30954 Transcript_23789/m.30954 type:complete len:82 (-) Transcript_23789:120-365(-)
MLMQRGARALVRGCGRTLATSQRRGRSVATLQFAVIVVSKPLQTANDLSCTPKTSLAEIATGVASFDLLPADDDEEGRRGV